MHRGCQTCEQWMEHCYWDHFPKSKRFLKTLTGDFSRRLCLPKKFTSYFKEKASQTVTLKGPAGDTWHVGIIEINGNLCLQNGWKEFVHAHHLRENDTLLFKYEGDSHFSVLMFDASECVKESAYFVKNNQSVQEQSGEMEYQGASEEPDVPPSSPPCVGPHEEVLRPNKYQKRENVPSKRKDDDEVSTPNPETGTKIVRGSSPVEGGLGPGNSRDETRKEDLPYSSDRLVTEEGKNKALELAVAFQPSGPSFVSLMTDYSITASFLTIPTEFARKYLPQNDTNITLRLPSGENDQWITRYLVTKRKILRFGSNWRGFASDNSLVAGDVCVFELAAKKPPVIITAHIFRA